MCVCVCVRIKCLACTVHWYVQTTTAVYSYTHIGCPPPHTMRLLSISLHNIMHATLASYSYVLTTRAAVRRVAVWRLAGQGDPRTHRHTQQNKTSHSTALSNLLQKERVTRGQSPTLHLGSSPAPSSGDVGLETVEYHHTARLNKAMEGFALNPASLPSIPERKGTLYLRSDHMKYGRATLNSNW